MTARTLSDLSPVEFEHLVFDLIRETGLRNLVWRTPGADGGRDIEGVRTAFDFSGSSQSEKWYIEAKRYAAAVDWPTVWAKIAYAENARADFLLMVTTSSFSPRCWDEIGNWNSRETNLKIRAWGRSELEFRLTQRKSVATKYGLVENPEYRSASLEPLSQELAKATVAAVESVAAASPTSTLLELAASIAELLLVRLQDLSAGRRLTIRPPLSTEPWFPWLAQESPLLVKDVDAPAFRALMCAIRVISGATNIKAKSTNPNQMILNLVMPKQRDLSIGQNLIDTICMWGDLETVLLADGIMINSRYVRG